MNKNNENLDNKLNKDVNVLMNDVMNSRIRDIKDLENNNIQSINENESMPELTDGFKNRYKDMVAEDIMPDMAMLWDRIEAALPEKKTAGENMQSGNAGTDSNITNIGTVTTNSNVTNISTATINSNVTNIGTTTTSNNVINIDNTANAGLKKNKKKKNIKAFYKYGAIIAACIAGLLIIPTVLLSNRSKSQSATDAAPMTADTADKIDNSNGFHFGDMSSGATSMESAATTEEAASDSYYEDVTVAEDAACDDGASYDDCDTDDYGDFQGNATNDMENSINTEMPVDNIYVNPDYIMKDFPAYVLEVNRDSNNQITYLIEVLNDISFTTENDSGTYHLDSGDQIEIVSCAGIDLPNGKVTSVISLEEDTDYMLMLYPYKEGDTIRFYLFAVRE